MSARTGRTTGIGIDDKAHEGAGWEADKKGGDGCGGGAKSAGPAAAAAGGQDGCCCIPCRGNNCSCTGCWIDGLYALRVAIV
jgi:hypothetical protein